MLQICKGRCSPRSLPLDRLHPRTVCIHGLKDVESAFRSKGRTLKRANALRQKLRKGMRKKPINNHSGITQRQVTLDDVGPSVATQCYHNNRHLIMLEVSWIKFSLDIQNSVGIIMCKFHAFQSKTEGMAASVRVFLNTPRT